MPNTESLRQHNLNYEKDDAFEKERKAHLEHNLEDFKFLYQDDVPHGDVLDSIELKIAVDIGSGTGWFANYLIKERNYKKVYAIEPSEAAINIAKRIYPDRKGVEYIHGFAEEQISKLKLKEPSFFSTMCVLAHLEDNDVMGILKSIDTVAPSGSKLVCSEPWGDFYHRQCWNIRPPEWWSDILAGWEFEFYNDYILTDPPGASKGFIATKL
jgi:SAM-dependent methyltransferase|tara:strand:+ start:299 stop:934 length:636 start_codon:yes stop_codon:yes gene_type:complete